MKNGITLVTYADCMGNNLKDLNQVLKKYIGNGVDIIHILPFFHQLRIGDLPLSGMIK